MIHRALNITFNNVGETNSEAYINKYNVQLRRCYNVEITNKVI